MSSTAYIRIAHKASRRNENQRISSRTNNYVDMKVELLTRIKVMIKDSSIVAVKYKPYRSLGNYKNKRRKQTRDTIRRIESLDSTADMVAIPGFAHLTRWSIAQG